MLRYYLALVFLISWAVIRKYRSRLRYPSTIPVVKGPKDLNYKSVIEAQYAEDPDRLYVLQTPFRDVLVLPPKFVNEYAWQPEHKVSSAVDLCERFQGRYTMLGSLYPNIPGDRTHTMVSYAKGFLTKNINAVIDSVYEEIDLALDRVVGQSPDSRSINVNDLVLTVFLQVYQRAYLGIDAARNEKWLRLCFEFPKVAFFAALGIAKWPRPLQPLANLFLPEMRRFRQYSQRVDDFLRPFHQDRLRAMENPDFKPPADYIQSYIESAGSERANTDLLVEGIGMTNIAGIQSTGRVLLQALLDLAAHPQYIEVLRGEVASLTQENNGNPNLSQHQLSRLDLMDSFFKESQKFHHANCLSVYRKIIQPMTLSNGTYLPANSYVALPGTAYSVIEKGGKKRAFDPFQWSEKKQTSENSTRFNYVFSGPDSLEFGAGTHVCPGRFFAVNVLKATLSRILMRYDFRLPDGTSRPEDQYNHLLDVKQNTKSVLEFRLRQPAMATV